MGEREQTLICTQEIVSNEQINISGELRFTEKGLFGETKEQIITLFDTWQDVIYTVAQNNGFYEGDAVKVRVLLNHCFGDRVKESKTFEVEIPFNSITQKVYFNTLMNADFKTMEEHIESMLQTILQFLKEQDAKTPFVTGNWLGHELTGDWLEYELKVIYSPLDK